MKAGRTYGSVDDGDGTSLDEVSDNEEVLLVRGDLEVMGSENGLVSVGVIETLGVVQVRDINSGDVATLGEGKVSELAIVGDIGVDGEGVLGLVAELEEELDGTLGAVCGSAERVDDPDFTGDDGSG